jgi:hypothetical protein
MSPDPDRCVVTRTLVFHAPARVRPPTRVPSLARYSSQVVVPSSATPRTAP